MKYVTLACLFMSVSFHASAEARVYTNADLKPERPAETASQEPSVPPSPSSKGLIPAGNAPLFTNKSLESFEQKNPSTRPGDGSEPISNLTPFGKGKPPAPAQGERGLIGRTSAGKALPMLIIVSVTLLVLSLIDILRNEFTGSNKLVWLVAVTFLPLLGPALYYFIGRGQRIRPGNLQKTA
jgi:hypothetical protein